MSKIKPPPPCLQNTDVMNLVVAARLSLGGMATKEAAIVIESIARVEAVLAVVAPPMKEKP